MKIDLEVDTKLKMETELKVMIKQNMKIQLVMEMKLKMSNDKGAFNNYVDERRWVGSLWNVNQSQQEVGTWFIHGQRWLSKNSK